jgi:tetratricopeptide (TPR) repeat protein
VSPQRYGILVAAALVQSCQPSGAPSADIANPKPTASPEQGVYSISGLTVKPDEDGKWLVDFDYSYEHGPGFTFQLVLRPRAGTAEAGFRRAAPLGVPPIPGQHHVSRPIQYPGEGTSEQVIVLLIDINDSKVLASQHIDSVITWPSQDEHDFSTAFELIEDGSDDQLRQARETLERLVGKNAQFDAAYVELARIAMKTNWGPAGFHQAETLLASAMKIRPESVNAKILLGYVYAHQHRFDEAEPLFADAARTDPPNLWLWTNWGELLEMQGHTDQAIAKYRETIKRPVGSIKYQRARENAYILLIQLLEKRNDLDGAEALYVQRIEDLREAHCYKAAYARFKLTARHDPNAAIDLVRPALGLNCEAPPRQLLGLASYLLWAEGSGAESEAALNQARVFLPAGPGTLYLLASNDSTMPAAKKLVASGEAIDQKDNDEMTALALALQNGEFAAVERLLALGAGPETPVTAAAIPVALLPVLDGNRTAIGVLQRAGVDYSKLRYRGSTALDFARQNGDDALLDALQPKGRTL